MEFWIQVLGEFGFPVTITFYLLYRMEKKLDTINRSILSLAAGRPLPPELKPPGPAENHLH
ncbi:YvrJ protein family protein [Alkalicoccus daliensis]|uniref:YvrJ protein family protein n=2 Tax=Alkalicoccus daliensis TaxID=745820 RepID=A0A1H0CSM6_9BACI|nr:YvrJ protein family protein [Alkalicoccus daliensis]